MAKRLTEILSDLFSEWGSALSPARPKPVEKRSLNIVIALPDERVITVGRLTVADTRFVFSYSDEFKKLELPPLPGFPNKEERYESDVLFPFFKVRLPPKSRDDVMRVMKERNVDDKDIFEILRVLGRKTLTSPYELQTSPNHPAFASENK